MPEGVQRFKLQMEGQRPSFCVISRAQSPRVLNQVISNLKNSQNLRSAVDGWVLSRECCRANSSR